MSHDILIVDDEADIRMLISGILEDEGLQTREASHADDALRQISARVPQLVILDIWMQKSRLDGLELLEEIHKQYPFLPVVMISGHGNIETAVKAIKVGAYDFIEKPFKTDRLLLIVERALEAAALRRENAALKQKIGTDVNFIGASPCVQALKNMCVKVAPTGSRILITGPSGSGKEIVARTLHDQSKRASGPFVVLNCANMRPDDLEEELFGVERLNEHKIGTFEQAHNGTLVLDEVSDMPLETQGKIVRILQDQSFKRVGGENYVSVDVRVIGITSQNLEDKIQEGTFREDLFYRLNVVPLEVPSLEARRQDIPELVTYFSQQISRQTGVSLIPFSEEALVLLQNYSWPGNVRQLRNVVEWMMIMAGSVAGEKLSEIGVGLLPPEITQGPDKDAQSSSLGELLSLPLRDARELFEKQYLESQVSRFDGNISKTASFVGMERSALHRKMKMLGITAQEKAKER